MWGKQFVFLDIPSTDADTLAPLLYQLSQKLPHLRLNLFVISETIATKL